MGSDPWRYGPMNARRNVNIPDTTTSVRRRVWTALAIVSLAACAETAPNMDAGTSGASTSTTVPTGAAVACDHAVVPGGVDDFPEARRRDVACPDPACARVVVPGGVDDFPEARRTD